MQLVSTQQKINKIFLEFRKTMRISKYNKKTCCSDDKEITDQANILEHVREFYKILLKTREQKTDKNGKNFQQCWCSKTL